MKDVSVPAGYKSTDIGVIPEDWTIFSINDCVAKITDGEHLTPQRSSSGYYLLSARNIQNGKIDLEDVDFVDVEEYQRIRKRCNPEFGDVLISCSGTIGRVAVVPENLQCVMVRSAALIKPKQHQSNGKYIQYFLQSKVGQKQIFASLNQGAQANLFLTHIQNLIISLPSLPEQKAIARVLSDVDELIRECDSLLAKKRDIKQGTMQQLLTGKQRLPGFSGEWEEKKLGDVVDFLDGQRKPIKNSDREKMRGSFPYYGASGIIDYVDDYIFDDNLILLGEDGENIISRNCRLVFQIFGKVWVNNHAHVLKPRLDININFLTEYLESLNYEEYNTGTAQPKLNKKVCSLIRVLLPTLPEQKAIAEILSDMDAEIEALEKKRDKYKAIKQGMMQELLTGRIRLIGNES